MENVVMNARIVKMNDIILIYETIYFLSKAGTPEPFNEY